MAKPLARTAVLLACGTLLVAPPVTAQSKWDTGLPAFVGLAHDGFLLVAAPPTFTGCAEGFVAINVTGMPNLDLWSGVLVLDEGAPLWDTHWVFTPFGAQNITFQSDMWVRVFPLQPGDLEGYLTAPCTFYGTHRYVAEGLARMNYHSADDALNGPGVNSWGWVIQGLLNDNGYCPAGRSPRLYWLQKWVGFSQTDVTAAKSTASKGPTLTCR